MEEPPRPAPAPDPDALLRRWRDAGDAAALGALFDATAPELFSVALHLCRDPALAEDALQETFLAALRHLDRFEADRRVVPWLAGILRNKVHEVRRFGARAPDPRRLPLPPDPEGPLAAAATAEEEARVRAALEDLEEPYREVAILRWRHGLEPAEIAAAKRMAPGTVRSLLHRAAGRLKRDLVGLPVLLLLREGPAAPRGLAAVRAEVIRRAPLPVLPAAAAGSASALLLGGALVANKLVVGGAILLAAAGAWWLAGRNGAEAPRPAGGGTQEAAAPSPPAPEAEAPEDPGPASPPLPLPPGAARATGIVVDREGRPVPGARVTSFPGDLARAVTMEEGSRPGSGLLAAVAGPDGRFTVELARLSPRATLLATAPGFTPAVLVEVIDGEEARLVLERAAAVIGTVVDTEGIPVAGAWVRVRRLLDALILDREGVSGADGRFRVEEVPAAVPMHGSRPAADMLAIEAGAEGFGPFFSGTMFPVPPALTAGAAWEVRIVLARGWTLRGKVVAAGGGEPVEGARVVAWDGSGGLGFGRASGSRMSPAFTPRPLGEAVTGVGGEFALSGLPASGSAFEARDLSSIPNRRWNAGVGAWKEGLCWTTARLEEAASGEEREVVLALEPVGAVEGRVLDGEGSPVAGARVFPNGAGLPYGGGLPPASAGDPGTSAVTDGQGRYRLAAVPGAEGGPRRVLLQAAKEDPFLRSTTPEEGVPVEAIPGRTVAAPDIVLAPTGRPFAEVLVTDREGRPVWGAQALLPGGAARSPVSDREGRMRVPGTVERGNPGKAMPLRILVRARGHGSAWADLAPDFAETPPTTVVLGPSRSLAGRVLEADGTPAGGASVAAAKGAGPVPAARDPFDVLPGEASGAGGATTAADGTFRIEDLPEGPFRLVARGASLFRGGTVPEEARESVLEDVPADAAGLEIRLPAPKSLPAGAVEGIVTDAETGAPILRCDAELSGPGGFFMAPRGKDNPGGRFRIEGVPAGEWRLQVYVAGYAPFVKEGIVVAAGTPAAPLEIPLSRGATATGTLRPPAGVSLRGYRISFDAADPGSGWAAGGAQGTVGEDGTFRVGGLRPGTWRVLLWREDGAGAEAPPLAPAAGEVLVVAAGASEVRLDAALAACGTLAVTVRDERFPPPGFEKVKATGEQDAFGRASRLLLLDGEGRTLRTASPVRRGALNFGWLALLPGEYAVRLESPAGAREERVRVEAGSEATAVFRGE